jgi:hypothetical protein
VSYGEGQAMGEVTVKFGSAICDTVLQIGVFGLSGGGCYDAAVQQSLGSGALAALALLAAFGWQRFGRWI